MKKLYVIITFICTIPEKGIVDMLYDDGPVATIKGTEGRWRHVKFGEEKDWVFVHTLPVYLPFLPGRGAEVGFEHSNGKQVCLRL